MTIGEDFIRVMIDRTLESSNLSCAPTEAPLDEISAVRCHTPDFLLPLIDCGVVRAYYIFPLWPDNPGVWFAGNLDFLKKLSGEIGVQLYHWGACRAHVLTTLPNSPQDQYKWPVRYRGRFLGYAPIDRPKLFTGLTYEDFDR